MLWNQQVLYHIDKSKLLNELTINKSIVFIYTGGQVLSTRCTQKYDIKSKAFSLFGFPLYYESSNPRTVIQGHPLQPGACWAFQDFPGYLVIQLRSIIYVTGFTMEHVSKLILPNENMSSAPKRFEVWVCKEASFRVSNIIICVLNISSRLYRD